MAQPWNKEQINASRIMDAEYIAADAPVWDADPMNIYLVVETGGQHISVLDGDTFKVLDRLSAPFPIGADPEFSRDGRYAFVVSCDGWVQKYDLWALKQVGRVRAGLSAGDIAISADDKWLAIVTPPPHALTILSATDLTAAAVIKVTGGDGAPSRVSGVYNNPQRESFIIALKDAPKVWEIFYGPNPPAMGFAHDWRIEGPVKPSRPFPIRRISTPDFLDDLVFDPSHEYVIGAARQGGGMVIDLVIGHKVADLDLSGAPHFGAGIIWKQGDANVMGIPHQQDAAVSVIEMGSWKTLGRITTQGPGLFVYSHANSNYFWAGVSIGQNKSVVHVIDKQTLKIVKTLHPAPDASLAQVAFGRTANQMLALSKEEGGAIIIYDTDTLQETLRLPMRNPSRIYNVGNRVAFR